MLKTIRFAAASLAAVLAVSLAVPAIADLCVSQTQTVTTLAANTPTTVGLGLQNRRQVTVCVRQDNVGAPQVQCRGDGTAVTLGATFVGDVIGPGQCLTYGVPAGIGVSCVTASAGTNVSVIECSGNNPPQNLVSGVPASGGSSSSSSTPRYLPSGAPTSGNIAVSTVSAAVCGLTPGAVYRLDCTATVRWRVGPATPTALTTDRAFFGPAVDYGPLGAVDTCFAFVTAAGTATCTLDLTRTSP